MPLTRTINPTYAPCKARPRQPTSFSLAFSDGSTCIILAIIYRTYFLLGLLTPTPIHSSVWLHPSVPIFYFLFHIGCSPSWRDNYPLIYSIRDFIYINQPVAVFHKNGANISLEGNQ
jgi:hypothetical protein